jgi:phosphoribosylaminoimidazolecarboxamide formyltransferase / IMP cyclohydrolase
MAKDLKSQYKTINRDSFPSRMEISFFDEGGRRTGLSYEKVEWTVEGEKAGLRYGENPDQPAALYRLSGGNLAIAGIELIQPGRWLVSEAELLQTGKHPGKTNITDVDSALNVLRYFPDETACAIMKHNNPSGAALAGSALEAYRKAYMADRIAAYGGAVVMNREIDVETAEAIAASYCEVVAAPEFAPAALEAFKKWKNLRVIRIKDISRLGSYVGTRFLDFKSLMDGGCVVQASFSPNALKKEDFLAAECVYQGKEYRVSREPTDEEWKDMVFGWLLETGITSNSVIYVKDRCTVGIGTGEQDRVGVAEIARDKAYTKLTDRIFFERNGEAYNFSKDENAKADALAEARSRKGGLPGSVMVSDAFFPFRDGVEVGLREGVTAVVQPGGAIHEAESIEACNEYGAAMKFTGQRCFKH